ncbi:hypothetical protein BJ508DRAFT_376690 [Ascobolus immersus RN42]|uniref:Uncharacterized protein n=1 Tax=Ascobolus immersus RN42 TaxID=1160509 RepID=A0A3N4I9X2_ASCIM|nr:hypothetical protein BJ508DRAFT_376690 [Ascobolus immersus RN42]
MGWMITALFVPEMVLFIAYKQWKTARKLTKEFGGVLTGNATEISESSSIKKLSRSVNRWWLEKQAWIQGMVQKKPDQGCSHDPNYNRHRQWTTSHSFMLSMGGLALTTNDESGTQFIPNHDWVTFTAKGARFILVAEDDQPTDQKLLNISKKRIEDKSKSDYFLKVITVLRTLFFSLNCIVRLCQRLGLTPLEVNTAMHVACALLMNILWLHKPHEVHRPIILFGERAARLAALLFQLETESSSAEWTAKLLGPSGNPEPEIGSVPNASVIDNGFSSASHDEAGGILRNSREEDSTNNDPTHDLSRRTDSQSGTPKVQSKLIYLRASDYPASHKYNSNISPNRPAGRSKVHKKSSETRDLFSSSAVEGRQSEEQETIRRPRSPGSAHVGLASDWIHAGRRWRGSVATGADSPYATEHTREPALRKVYSNATLSTTSLLGRGMAGPSNSEPDSSDPDAISELPIDNVSSEHLDQVTDEEHDARECPLMMLLRCRLADDAIRSFDLDKRRKLYDIVNWNTVGQENHEGAVAAKDHEKWELLEYCRFTWLDRHERWKFFCNPAFAAFTMIYGGGHILMVLLQSTSMLRTRTEVVIYQISSFLVALTSVALFVFDKGIPWISEVLYVPSLITCPLACVRSMLECCFRRVKQETPDRTPGAEWLTAKFPCLKSVPKKMSRFFEKYISKGRILPLFQETEGKFTKAKIIYVLKTGFVVFLMLVFAACRLYLVVESFYTLSNLPDRFFQRPDFSVLPFL